MTIPVKLFSAVQESELDLDMLDAKDQARIRFQRINEDTGKEVPFERIVKAFDLDGKYVVLDDKDFQSAAVEQSEVIAIKDFVKEEEVEGKYYEKPYYLAPDKGGARAYALLREALKKSGKVGIASFVMRTKEHPAVLQPDGAVLILNQMRFAQELRPVDELDLPKVEKVPAGEMKLAMQLIEQGAGKFDIANYKDEYSAALMKAIKAKAKRKGKSASGDTMKVVHKKPTGDLMAALKASLGKKTTPAKKAKSTNTTKKTKPRKAS